MNAVVDVKAPQVVRPVSRGAEDYEFLPAALEILHTPPSPVRMWLLLEICALAAAALVWAFFSHIDIIAIAQGKIQSAGRVKLVQPVELGKVHAIFAENGTHVTKDELLVELDSGEAQADEAALVASLASYRAEALRRSAAIESAGNRSFAPPAVNWPANIPTDIAAREARVLSGDLSQLAAATNSLTAQRDQKAAEQTRFAELIVSQKRQLEIGSDRLEMRTKLEAQALGSKLNRLDAEDSLQQQRTSLVQQKGQLNEATAAIKVLERDATKAVETFIAENGQKLADAERQVQELDQRLVKAQAKVDHMVLRAPVSGVVQGLTINSIGQVILAGEDVMRIVPDDVGFEIESYLPNKDVGFVSVGQEAVVKIEAYPFTRYGTLTARVGKVGRDAIPEPEATQQESGQGRTQRSKLTGGAERTQNLYFPIVLTLDKMEIGENGKLPISNGMAVNVEIKTGSRRLIDYIFSPLVEIGAGALRER
jgi:hemolysin D